MVSQEQQRGKGPSRLPGAVHQLVDVKQHWDSYYIDGREVHQMTFVGRIVNVQGSVTNSNVWSKIHNNIVHSREVRKWNDKDYSTTGIDKNDKLVKWCFNVHAYVADSFKLGAVSCAVPQKLLRKCTDFLYHYTILQKCSGQSLACSFSLLYMRGSLGKVILIVFITRTGDFKYDV
jgi:hypothetical protein